MKNLRNIKKVPFEIAQLLANNPDFCALLVDDSDTPTACTMSLTELLNQHYLVIYPPTNDGSINNFNRNTYAIILLDSIDTNSDNYNINVTGYIYITTDNAHVLLSNNRNRLLEMADIVLQTLNGVKLTSAGELQIGRINYVMIDTFKSGYRIGFTITDQQTERTEI